MSYPATHSTLAREYFAALTGDYDRYAILARHNDRLYS